MITKLKELRTEKNFTQSKIAEMLHISQQTYSDYEKGRTNPDIVTLISIADILDTTIDYLLGREDDFGNIVIQTNGSPQLTDPERTLLTAFKRLPPDLQVRAIAYVQGLDDAINGPARKYSPGK